MTHYPNDIARLVRQRWFLDVVTPYLAASGACQINAVFPVTPQSGAAIAAPKAPAAKQYRVLFRL